MGEKKDRGSQSQDNGTSSSLNQPFATRRTPYLDAVLLAGLHVVLEVADPFTEEVQPLGLVDGVGHLGRTATVHLERAHLI